MIREVICYRCKCSKCGGEWVTKGHDLPFNCAKCKSRLWNDDYVPDHVAAFTPTAMEKFLATSKPVHESPMTVETMVRATEEMTQKFAEENDWRFTKDKPQFADDGNVYRLQCLVSDPRKTRTVRVDELDHDEILSVNKKR